MILTIENVSGGKSTMISFSLSDEQKELQQLAREFAQKEIAPVASQLDRTG
jgi:alkylation response protein AidB-like acyl-CoA dehydrogenase